MDNRPSHLRWGYGELVIVCLAPAFLASRLKDQRWIDIVAGYSGVTYVVVIPPSTISSEPVM